MTDSCVADSARRPARRYLLACLVTLFGATLVGCPASSPPGTASRQPGEEAPSLEPSEPAPRVSEPQSPPSVAPDPAPATPEPAKVTEPEPAERRESEAPPAPHKQPPAVAEPDVPRPAEKKPPERPQGAAKLPSLESPKNEPDKKPPPARPQERPAEKPPETPREKPPQKPPLEAPAVTQVRRALEPPPASLHEPRVLFTEAHADTCLVNVGDLMPEIALPDLSGETKTLSDLYGERLTVVVFWNRGKVFAQEQFSRLPREVAERYSATGLQVVAINVGDSSEVVRQLSQQTGAAFPSLLDAEGRAMALVARQKLPRTYLLDAAGKILWMDIEYSRSTRRELRNAVYYFLRDNAIIPAKDG